MSRIAQTLRATGAAGPQGVIPYIVAGDPALEAHSAADASHGGMRCGYYRTGCAVFRPMAEGPVIQQAHERALANGVTSDARWQWSRSFVTAMRTTPVLLMGYANPVLRMGLRDFVDEAQAQDSTLY